MKIELFLGIIGTIIALAAAITTIWQGVLTRRHNRLSVKPILRIERFTVIGKKVNIFLTNTGVGPAIINSVKYYVDGIIVEQGKIIPSITTLKKIGLNSLKYTIGEILPQETFSSGEQQSLFESKDEIADYSELTNIMEAYDRLAIEVEYESIYGEKFHMINSRKQHLTRLSKKSWSIKNCIKKRYKNDELNRDRVL